MAREFRKVGIVGLGTMGAGIAEVLAHHGVRVVGVDVSDDAIERGRLHLHQSTSRAVARGKLSDAERAAVLDRVSVSTSLQDVKDADLVLEAVPEDLGLKRRIFAELDEICTADAVLATNTSSLSVTEISAATKRPSRVVGLHFFNPAQVMRSVEVVRTMLTDPDVVADVECLLGRLGKVGVTVGDKAGFLANSLLFGYLNHAVVLYENGYASREDIDTAMRVACGLPMGPLALLDLIGLDIAYQILEALFNESRAHRHAPAPLLRQMNAAGLCGRKTGCGFYTYEAPNSPAVLADDRTPYQPDRVAGARPVDRVGVVGSGSLARSIVESALRAGYTVVFVPYRAPDCPADQGDVDALRDAVERELNRSLARGQIDELSKKVLSQRIIGSTRYRDLADSDLVIEAVPDDPADKRAVFTAVDGVVNPAAVLVTTTSASPVIETAMATGRPSAVVGAHFSAPAPGGPLVEVVQTIVTAPDAADTVHAFARRIGRHVARCHDRAGFLVQTLLFPHLGDAVRMLQARYASVADIDTAMKYGCAYPTGPLEMLDSIGLDTALAVYRRLYREYRDPGYAPPPLLEHLVKAGYLGRKTGRGFHDYGG